MVFNRRLALGTDCADINPRALNPSSPSEGEAGLLARNFQVSRPKSASSGRSATRRNSARVAGGVRARSARRCAAGRRISRRRARRGRGRRAQRMIHRCDVAPHRKPPSVRGGVSVSPSLSRRSKALFFYHASDFVDRARSASSRRKDAPRETWPSPASTDATQRRGRGKGRERRETFIADAPALRSILATAASGWRWIAPTGITVRYNEGRL